MQGDAAESLLRDLLGLAGERSPDAKVTRNHFGKPILVTSNGPSAIQVSLSHSGLISLAAITNLGEIGVDLEARAPRRSISEIAAYAFGPQEQRSVESDGLLAFYRIWTLREAMAKARGLGFPILTDRRDYFPNAPDSGAWQREIDGRGWLFWTGDLSGEYAVAVAIALRSPFHEDCIADLTPRPFDRPGEPPYFASLATVPLNAAPAAANPA